MTQFTLAGERVQRPLAQPAFRRWELPDGRPWAFFHRDAPGYLLRFPDLADFQVSDDGQQVLGWAVPTVGPATVEHLYLNQVLPLALGRQGKLVLHASAIDLGGAGVAFIGESGRGKSTLAASFATSGTRFLSDDGLQLQLEGQELMAIPSHPSIRLWEDSQTALVGDTGRLAPGVEYTPKARLLAGPGLAHGDHPVALRATYFLGPGEAETVQIEPVAPGTAVLELLKHSFLLDIAQQEALAEHFDDITTIANRGRFFRLDYPRDFAVLSQVRQAIVHHAKRFAT